MNDDSPVSGSCTGVAVRLAISSSMFFWVTLVLPSWSAGQVPTVAIGQLYPYSATPSTSLVSSCTAFLAAPMACSTNDNGAIGPAFAVE